MGIRVFSTQYLESLTAEAEASPRTRQHRNVHADYADPVQRLFNAIEPNSYIRPHRHVLTPRAEMMIAVRGQMALVLFDDSGKAVESVRFGVSQVDERVAAGVEIPPNRWHTVIALQPGSILLEVKAGPFDPKQSKEFAIWAPEEGTLKAKKYHQALLSCLREIPEREFV